MQEYLSAKLYQSIFQYSVLHFLLLYLLLVVIVFQIDTGHQHFMYKHGMMK